MIIARKARVGLICRSRGILLNCPTMNPIRRELLNGLFVLVVASLMSTAVAAFQVNFNVQLWVLILMGIAIAVSSYVIFEITLGGDGRICGIDAAPGRRMAQT